MTLTNRELFALWSREGRRHLPVPALELLDRRMVALGRGVGGLRLRIGEALEAFARSGGPHEMGFSSLGAYALERVARSGRWAADSRSLARKVSELPAVRTAVLCGRLSWSKAELVARVATPEDEDAWVAEAEGVTVRVLRNTVREGLGAANDETSSDTGDEADEKPARRTMAISVAREDAWAFEATRMLVAALVGTRPGVVSADDVIETMLAERLSALRVVG